MSATMESRFFTRMTEGRPKDCDTKGENRPPQERLIHPAVSAAMIELLKAPLDIGVPARHPRSGAGSSPEWIR